MTTTQELLASLTDWEVLNLGNIFAECEFDAAWDFAKDTNLTMIEEVRPALMKIPVRHLIRAVRECVADHIRKGIPLSHVEIIRTLSEKVGN